MADRPNVLFLLSDEHSFRCLSFLDDQRGEPVNTPALDNIAARGTTFDRAYCQMPLCTPSRICMLTGREVRRCNGWGNGNVLPSNCPTIPDAFGGAGYDTCLVGKMHLGGDRQFVGFDDRPYGDLTGGAGHQWEPLDRVGEGGKAARILDAGVSELPESRLQEYTTTRESLSWIREREASSDGPWFLCASLSRPHFPLTAPRRYVDRYWDLEQGEPTGPLTEPKVKHGGDTADHPLTEAAIEGFELEDVDERSQLRARAFYFACVDFLDDVVGEFLATLERDGLLENTIIVYTSDHGELAGEHGLWWKHTWHEAATRVPFLVQTPAHRADDYEPATIETPVSLADLFPTLCGLASVDIPDCLDGMDLSTAVETGAEPDRDPIVCDNLVPRWGIGTEFRVVRDGRYKYVRFRDAPELLFDLDADPDEHVNLAADPDDEVREALNRLRREVTDTLDFETAAAERERDKRIQEEHRLDVGTSSASENCYLTDDGTIVDADCSLYDSTVVVEDPASTFDDFPDE
ncbi:sulfatase family protein [Halomontanus rarus]|uniref:sulfatase family protein n=1 Tax=Halomontanus rarus TaxID=3034020 RepID=UPI0023E808D1|nr:sulfatase-like hydrolase/transferase [Halovivax sp. TS33]